MPRNLDRRVEIIFPVEDDDLKLKVKHILDVQLRDNLKAYHMTSAGTYVKSRRSGKKLGAQDTFCKEAKAAVRKKETDFFKGRSFTPITASEVEDE